MAIFYHEDSKIFDLHTDHTTYQMQVDRFGFVRNVCGAPTFDRPGVAPEGQAFFIMMEAAAIVR